MALSVRTRFEVFKRDEFTCKYCGRRSPEVILECDHIVPVSVGGSDDPINLTTSCWDCNRGKAGVPLASVMTGEDPHDRAIELLERKRQLEEYNRALEMETVERENKVWELWKFWQTERGRTSEEDLHTMPKRDRTWLLNTLVYCPRVKLVEFMEAASAAGATRDFRYVAGCVRNWREAKPPVPEPQESPQETSMTSNYAAALEEFEYVVSELQRVAGLSRPDAIETLVHGDRVSKDYERSEIVKTVLREIADIEYWRRHIGCCPHQQQCQNFILCVLREASIRLDVETQP
jgi:hypothetical protein